MKRHLSLFVLSIFFGHFAIGQSFLPDTFALERVLVEKYYESNTTDDLISLGQLPAGSITYRIYADLKPGYSVSGLVGLTSPTSHPLSISVSNDGSFYNNAFGVSLGSELSPLFFTIDELAALDSYLALGAATTEHFGILKGSDTDESSLLGASPSGVLQGEGDIMCQPSLTIQDGLISEENVPAVNTVGIPSGEISKLQTTVSEGSFEITDGSWFVPESVIGINEDNRVLIGQFTAIGGLLEFDINIVVLIPEELQCNVTPACQKSSITYTATFQDGDSEYNTDPESNNVQYQTAWCSYSDDGEACADDLNTENSSVLAEKVSLFPNPTSGDMRVQFTAALQDVQYDVFDATGRLMISTNIGSVRNQESFLVNTSSLRSGIYIMQVRSGEDVSSTKFIVEK